MPITLFLIIGIIFGFLAGLIAFGITYIEWQKHKFTDWQLWREPLQRGFLTFLFFLVLSIALGYMLPFVI